MYTSHGSKTGSLKLCSIINELSGHMARAPWFYLCLNRNIWK